MATEQNNRIDTRLDTDIIYEGIIVGRGILRSIDASSALVIIESFPLDANTFLELDIHFNEGKVVRVPVRLLDNTGEALEVALEGIDTAMLAELIPE